MIAVATALIYLQSHDFLPHPLLSVIQSRSLQISLLTLVAPITIPWLEKYVFEIKGTLHSNKGCVDVAIESRSWLLELREGSAVSTVLYWRRFGLLCSLLVSFLRRKKV